MPVAGVRAGGGRDHAKGIQIDGQTPADLDELDLVCIDPLPSWTWYQDMADFAEAITGNSLIDDEAADRLLAGHPDPDLP